MPTIDTKRKENPDKNPAEEKPVSKGTPRIINWFKKFWGWLLGAGALVIALLTLLFGENVVGRTIDFFSNISATPRFEYIYEGAFNQNNPVYEVAFPLGWGVTTNSSFRIVITTKYSGNNITGPVYIKIQRNVSGEAPITIDEWDDFFQRPIPPKKVSLTFEKLFYYAQLSSSGPRPDYSKKDWMSGEEGSFELIIENQGKKLDSKTITVVNTPWTHTTYLSDYEFSTPDSIKAFIHVKNYGASSDFMVNSCVYSITTSSFQVDLNKLIADNWYPEKGLERKCNSNEATPLTLAEGEEQTVVQDVPSELIKDVGVYALLTYVEKRLAIYQYDPGVSWHETDQAWKPRDGREWSTFMVLGASGAQSTDNSAPNPTITPTSEASSGNTDQTATSTPNPTLTFTPTMMLPSLTQLVPTATSTPSAVPSALPLIDNFDQGLNAAWFTPIPSGKWFTANGKLTLSGLNGRENSYIFIGDKNWSDYTIDLDSDLNSYTMSVGVIVRSDPPNQMGLRFVVSGYTIIWQVWQNDNWQTINTKNRPTFNKQAKIHIEVRGGSFSGTVDGLTQLKIDYPGVPDNGLIGLTSDCNSTSDYSTFDNLVIGKAKP